MKKIGLLVVAILIIALAGPPATNPNGSKSLPEKSSIIHPYDRNGTIVKTPGGDSYRARLFTADLDGDLDEETIIILIFYYGPNSKGDRFFAQIPTEFKDYTITWRDVSIRWEREGEHLWLVYPPDFELVQEG